MTRTIGNPLSWSVDAARATGVHLESMAETLGGHEQSLPRIRRLEMSDLRAALRAGAEDFRACRSDVIFLCIFYPVIGGLLAWTAFHNQYLALIFPIISGFALVGPVAAVGLYELSRLREQGRDPSWADAFAVTRSPRFAAIFALGLMLLAVFVVWILTANGIYAITLGPDAPVSLTAFAHDVVMTEAGLVMTALGLGIGLLFAALVLMVSTFSFPLLLDRDVGLPIAVITSVRVAAANPGVIATWGLIVAGLLALGALPLFLGLILVMPILGHATWHLYRRAVVVESDAHH